MPQATDPRPHAEDPAAFLAEDATTQTARLTALLASVPATQRPALLTAYTLGQSAAALPFFAQGIEQGRAMERASSPDGNYLTGYSHGLHDRPALTAGIRDMQAGL